MICSGYLCMPIQQPFATPLLPGSSSQLVSAFQRTLPTSCNSNRSKVSRT